MPEEPNYLSLAFKSQYNLISLGTAIGFALLSANPLPLLLVLGAQMIVLPLVAGSERYQRAIKAKLMEDERQQKQANRRLEASEMLRALSDQERNRYRGLETLAAEIRENYQSLDASSQSLLDEVVSKLDFLIAFYLRMRYSVARYEAYFQTTDPERIRHRLTSLEREMAQGPERVRAIKARTANVLKKRMERYEKALENRQLVDAQTETVLEVLQLLRDQSYSMRDPREITAQLDGLVSAAEETERGVRDMEDILSTEDELLLGGSLAGLEADLEGAGGPAPGSRPVAKVPVSAPPSAEPVPR
ncbi:MAG TPA: hypothetical protein VIC87_12980, partial [Vicinamibacteria bacterium]